MDTQLNFSELYQAKNYIDHISFDQIIDKLVHHQGWLLSDAQQVCQMYRRFLFLNKKYGKTHKIPPSEDIDEFWHAHILDTRRYQEDCQEIFGKYLEHYPYFGIDDQTNFSDLEGAFAQMQQLYFHEFGEHLYTVRGKISVLIALFKRLFSAKPKKVLATASTQNFHDIHERIEY